MSNRNMRRNSIPDPSWKSGPMYPEPSASEHAIEPFDADPRGMDIDGVGVDEAERIDGTPLLAVREHYRCPRDGCDAEYHRVHLYRLEDVDMSTVVDAYGCETPRMEEFLYSRATVVDHDGEEAYIGFETSGEPVDYVAPCHTIVVDDAGGPCYGHVEPEPDLDAYRYGL